MDAQSPSSHKRSDSVVDGTESISDTLATAQSFCAAVSTFTSEHGYQIINELVQIAPRHELEIKQRDETIRVLGENAAALQREHDIYTRQQLSDFEARYDEWKEESTALQKEIEELESAFEEKNSEVIRLQKQLKDVRARTEDLERESTEMTKRVKERGQRLGELEARLQSAQADMKERDHEIEQVRDQMGVMQGAFDNEVSQHKALKDEANKVNTRLKNFIQLSVKITELDLPDTTLRLERLWRLAGRLVADFFSHGAPDSVLKSDWTRLRDNDIFKHQIPLPQSNTHAARTSRTAVVLGTLTRLVDKFIFQPTYLLDEESGLRETLRDQAAVDPMKERYIRGILLSMLLEDQETNSEGAIRLVIKELLETADVQTLLPPEALTTFTNSLNTFVRQCQEEWKVIQRGKQKLEPSFAYSTCADHPWQLFVGADAT
ncbi:hypothetical protein E8E11_010564, partial [Didymella keratinophila]